MQVLSSLEPHTDEDLVVGASTMDDAAVLRWPEDCAHTGPYMVQTVDVITPVVDDPYTFGGVAAANALSDVYAMGGTPRFALNIIGFPQGTLPLDVLKEILAGGAAKAKEAGIPIVGGHSINDPEPKYGLVVTGAVDPRHLITNRDAQPGDVLVLTKPLGTGLLLGALKRGELSQKHYRQLSCSMLALNDSASLAMVQLSAHAATDVTGFGLLGHAMHIAKASNITLRIQVDAVPALPGAQQLARKAPLRGAAQRNWAYVEGCVQWRAAPHLKRLLVDPQTSGGLLIALPASKAAELIQRLEDKTAKHATVIGEIAAGKPQIIVS